MRLRSWQRRCWSSLDDLCGRPFANTARYLVCMVVAVRQNSPIAHYKISKISAADSVAKPPSEENLGRGEGMEVGAGFPVHHGFGSLRYSLLRGATQRHSRDCSVFRSATARSSVLMVILGQMNTHGAARSQAAAVFPRTQHTIASIGRMADTIAVIQPHRCG